MKKNNVSRFVLGFVKITGIIPALIFFKPKVILLNSNCRRRLKKPSILMSNHNSLLDFVLYLVLFPFSTIRFLMAEVLYNKGKFFSSFLYKLGGIKVDRDAMDLEFVAQSLEVLDNKGIVGVFPEGRLPVNGIHFPFKSGISFIASKTDAPIIPVYTDGNYGLLKRAHVIIGEEIYIQDMIDPKKPINEEISKVTEFLEKETYRLKDELEKRLGKRGK